MKSLWWAALVSSGWALIGCGPRPTRCESWQIERDGMCFGNCNVVAPPCFAEDGGLVFADAVAGDGSAMDALVCGASTMMCSGACVDTQRDPSHCGRCGATCMAGAGERGVCMAGQCRAECVAGFERVGMNACDAPVLRLLGPMSTSYVSSQRPTLRWVGAAGLDGAVVEVCSSRDCAMVVQRGVVSGGATSWRVERALSAGVYFWRVRGRSGMNEGTRSSAVWEFVVGARDRGTDTQWGTLTDVNGDGFGDVVVGGRSNPRAMYPDQVLVYVGRAMGIAATADTTLAAVRAEDAFGATVASAGDVNGDGFGDVIVGAPFANNDAVVGSGTAALYLGSPAGLSMTPQRLSGTDNGEQFAGAVSAAGDVNGDGYGDIVVGAPGARSAGRAASGRIYVFLGGPMGVRATPARVIDGTVSNGHLGQVVTGAHDFEADRFADIVVSAPMADDLIDGENQVGIVMLFRGGAMGIAATADREWKRVERMGDNSTGYQLGAAISRPGDVNGDGFGDVFFGSGDVRNRDVVRVSGAMNGLSASFERVSVDAGGTFVGLSVDCGDVDGDGFDDLAMSWAPMGAAVTLEVRAGSSSLLRPAVVVASSNVWGGGVMGDVNGDGRAEVVATAGQLPVIPSPRYAQVFRGSAPLMFAMPDWTVNGTQFR